MSIKKLFACDRARSTPNWAFHPPPRSASAAKIHGCAKNDDESDLPAEPGISGNHRTVRPLVLQLKAARKPEFFRLGRPGSTAATDLEISAASCGVRIPHSAYPVQSRFFRSGKGAGKGGGRRNNCEFGICHFRVLWFLAGAGISGLKKPPAAENLSKIVENIAEFIQAS